ncbi:unnamed protein product [Strongylus vulgaris]|uniref:Uncharacterized protein n=1 Tax=Strongylus vulgaris TaxID=40348 RepID=A0A3P7J3K2_STRVU|nr:unnamed protein product [Strongylus vulgaris]
MEVGVLYILPGEGSGHTRVKFRLVVFRPHVDEVIQARVVSSNSHGLTLSVWYWEYPSEDGQPPAKLYMDPGKTVRFRVVENIFR